MSTLTRKWTKRDARTLQALTRKIIKQDGGDHNIRAMAYAIETQHGCAPEAPPEVAFASVREGSSWKRLIQETRAPADRVRMVVLIGPAASGKTRLAQWLGDRVKRSNEPIPLRCGWANATELVNQLPQMLEQGVAIIDDVRKLTPAVGQVFGDFVGCARWFYRVAGTQHMAEIKPRGWLIITTPNEKLLSPDLAARAIVIRLKGRN